MRLWTCKIEKNLVLIAYLANFTIAAVVILKQGSIVCLSSLSKTNGVSIRLSYRSLLHKAMFSIVKSTQQGNDYTAEKMRKVRKFALWFIGTEVMCIFS